MTVRYRWFSLGIPYRFEQLAERLQDQKIGENSESGFTIELREPTHIFGEFVSSNRLKVLRIQPDGSVAEEILSTLTLISFSIFSRSKKTWLRISEPPHSTRVLTNALERAIGMGFFAEPLLFSFTTVNSILQRMDSYRLVSTKGVAALHESNAIARIEVASKDGLDLERLPLLKGLEYVMDTAAFEVTFRREKGQVSFTKSGLVRVNGRLAEYIVELLEDSLS